MPSSYYHTKTRDKLGKACKPERKYNKQNNSMDKTSCLKNRLAEYIAKWGQNTYTNTTYGAWRAEIERATTCKVEEEAFQQNAITEELKETTNYLMEELIIERVSTVKLE